MVIINTLDQNANAVVELVFAITMTSGFEVADKSTAFTIAHRHGDFIKNRITGGALHDKRVIAVRDQFPDVSDEKMSNEDGCLSRSMTIKACDKLQPARGNSRALTPENKDSIDEELLMRLPKGVTLINMACVEEVLEAVIHEVLSARTHL